MYELLQDPEPQFHYLKYAHLKPSLQLCVRGHAVTQPTFAELQPNAAEVRARSKGKPLVLEIKGRESGTLVSELGNPGEG